MNRLLSAVRSMADNIVELSRGVVTTPTYVDSKSSGDGNAPYLRRAEGWRRGVCRGEG